VRSADLRAIPRAVLGRPFRAAQVHTRGPEWILRASCVPRWRGWPPKAAGGGCLLVLPLQGAFNGAAFPRAASRVPRDLPRAILNRPFRAAGTGTQYRRIREQPSASQVGAAPRGCPPVRTGTRCRAADGAWNMSPFLPGVFRLCGLGALCGQSLELDLVPESLGAPFSSSARLPSGSGFE